MLGIPAFAFFVVSLCAGAFAFSDRGIIYLDDLTFDKIVDGSKHVLVRFDKEYAWGDSHDQFKELAKKVGGGAKDVLITSVPVSKKEYEPMNADLAARYGVEEKDFPVYLLFPKKTTCMDTPMIYDGKPDMEPILSWVSHQTGAFFGLKGQIQTLDTIARKYLAGAADDMRNSIENAKQFLTSVAADEKVNAEYYVKVMERILEKGVHYVASEQQRMHNLLSDSKSMSSDKKESFNNKLNILMSFNPSFRAILNSKEGDSKKGLTEQESALPSGAKDEL